MKTASVVPVVLLTSAVLVFGCGGKKEESDTETVDANNPLSVLSNVGDIAENMQNKQEEAAQVMEARKKRGDTLAIPYKDLQQYLPTSVAGYEKDGDPTGESTTQMNMSFSTAQQRFKKGDDYIEVSIADYNQAYGAWQALFSMAGMFSVENDEEKMGKFDIGVSKTTAVETYKKKSKDASVTVGTGYRFWIEVKGNNQPDTDFVKEVAKGMDLKKLSEM
ncbi:MAG: hypothetical protein MUD08_07540 [Cytophagales bacterium]|jgi:hypothetical protein|nr:hypothetical protein [Cytophagales bacterium]